MKPFEPDYFCGSFMDAERAASRALNRRLWSVLGASALLFGVGWCLTAALAM